MGNNGASQLRVRPGSLDLVPLEGCTLHARDSPHFRGLRESGKVERGPLSYLLMESQSLPNRVRVSVPGTELAFCIDGEKTKVPKGTLKCPRSTVKSVV